MAAVPATTIKSSGSEVVVATAIAAAMAAARVVQVVQVARAAPVAEAGADPGRLNTFLERGRRIAAPPHFSFSTGKSG